MIPNPTSYTQSLGWDDHWRSLPKSMVQLFTRTKPRTIHQFWQKCYFEDLWKLMGDRAQNAKWLEMGAGRGTTSTYLVSRGCNVTMLDLSPAGFALAKENFEREGLTPPQMVLADARETNLPAGSQDCVFSIGLIEHFDDPRPVLQEALRLLRPGGLHFALIIPERPDRVRLLVYALLRPWSFVWALLPQSLRQRVRPAKPRDTEPQEFRAAISREEYLKMLKEMGVKNAACIGYNPYHPVYSSPFLERNLTLRAYRLHHSIKMALSAFPLLATWSSVASCDLLLFWKDLI